MMGLSRVSARIIAHRETLLMLAFCYNWLQASRKALTQEEGLKCVHGAPSKERGRPAVCNGRVFEGNTLAAAKKLQRSCESAIDALLGILSSSKGTKTSAENVWRVQKIPRAVPARAAYGHGGGV
jgi:hypothetical protein